MNIIDYDKFTNKLRNVLRQSDTRRLELNKKEIEIEDLWWSLVNVKGTMAYEILNKSGYKNYELVIRPEINENKEIATGDKEKKINQPELFFSALTKNVLARAVFLAADLAHDYVGTEHLLWAMLESKNEAVEKLINKAAMNKEKLQGQLRLVFQSVNNFNIMSEAVDKIGQLLNKSDNVLPWQDLLGDSSEELAQREVWPTEVKEKEPLARKKSRAATALDIYGRDLTSADNQATIDPVVGRQKEINRVIQILLRRTKNNPVLLGDPGVGKTAIVEGLAKKIFLGTAPDILLDKKIYALDVNLMLAGTMMRGEFEARLKRVIEEVKSRSEVILFIDELHNIVGAGSNTGAMDAANILKPALARGELRCIGATTYGEYKKYVEEDPALERRFQAVRIAEPTAQETLEILSGLKKSYEEHHRVKIGATAIAAAVGLSERYLPEKFLPDKAIDLIDEAAAKKRLACQVVNEEARELKFLQAKLASFMAEKDELVRQEKYEQALELKESCERWQKKLAAIELDITAKLKEQKWWGEVGEREVAEVVGEMTGIPVENLSEEKGKNFDLTKLLKDNIIGQEPIIDELAFYLKRAKAGLAGGQRPMGSFLFLGPSGVGKTATAKVLAEKFFHGSEEKNALIRLDMAEFAEGFNVARLIGAPAGYIGYKEGGRLTEAVRRQPYSVVLFDEIEKAHPEVFNVLLQIFDEGFLTDAAGKKVNFKNTIIVLTANMGSQELTKAAIGFGNDGINTMSEQKKFQEIESIILKEVRSKFRPEFLDRLDKIFVFAPLALKSVEKITALKLQELAKRVAEQKKIKLTWAKKVSNFLAKTAYQPETGARQVGRTIEKQVEEPLAEAILSGQIKNGQTAELAVNKNKIIIS